MTLLRHFSTTFSAVKSSASISYCYNRAKLDPLMINSMVNPSVFKLNFSPRIMGERTALNMIVHGVVADISIMVPKLSATQSRN